MATRLTCVMCVPTNLISVTQRELKSQTLGERFGSLLNRRGQWGVSSAQTNDLDAYESHPELTLYKLVPIFYLAFSLTKV